MRFTTWRRSEHNAWRSKAGTLALVGAIWAFPTACGTDTAPVAPAGSPGPGANGPVAAVEISPGQVSTRPGARIALTATLLDADGEPISGVEVSWVSSDPAIASVSAAGVLVAHIPGSVTVTASADGISDDLPVSVLAPVAAVAVQPGSIDLLRGRAVQAQAILTDDEGTVLSGRQITWRSDDPAVAMVSEGGRVEAVGKGSTSIRAESEGVTGSAVMQVTSLDFAAISAGMGHTCALAVDGSAWCWGANEHGQLGTGDKSPSATPKAVSGGHTFASIAAGAGYTCAVTPTGAGYCWGDNSMMELGNRQAGKTSAAPVPVQSAPALAATGGASNMAHTCALTTTGLAYCWGYNRFGMVGNGSVRDEPYPLVVVGGLSYVALSAAHMRTCAVAAGGDVYCWGRGGRTQLGNPNAVVDTCDGMECAMSPRALGDGRSYSAVATGRIHTCAITTGGGLYCWGDNSAGQIGDGTVADVVVPRAIEPGRQFVDASAGDSHSCAVRGDGRAMCWGANPDGRVGNGGMQATPSPVPVSGGLRFQEVSAGYTHTCGVSTNGELYCWGDNMMGQLGDGTSASRLTPERVAEP